MSECFLDIRKEQGVDWVTFDRPEAMNALSLSAVQELLDYFGRLASDETVRAVVLRGAGGNYCAGLDIKQELPVLTGTPEECMAFMRRFGDIVIRMRRCTQPIISILDGAVAGGGLAFALASDLRIATPGARLTPAFLRLGLSGAEMGISYLLPRLVGAAAASEILLCGRVLDAQGALRLGLVSRIEPETRVVDVVNGLLSEMLSASPLALRLTKEALLEAEHCSGIEAAIAIENRNQALAFLGGAPREGVNSFIEKRAPCFEGGK